MRKIAGVWFGGLLATMLIAACVGDDPSNSPPTGNTDAGGGGACTAAQKTCNGQCASKDDPNAGCASPDCTPCAAATNAAPACKAGACSFACNPGFDDCDGNPTTGCESKTSSDPVNCGACGHVCGTANTDTPTKCDAGKCVFACKAGFGHCGSGDETGCETDLLSTPEHCGACGHSCLGGKCTAGKCEPFELVSISSPHGVAVDSKHVYISSIQAASVVRVQHDGKCGTAPVCPEDFASVAAGDDFAKVRGAAAVATDGTNVFWLAQATGTIHRKPATGGAITASWGPASGSVAGTLAIGGGKVWWTNSFGSAEPTAHVLNANLDGSGVATVANFSAPIASFRGDGGVATDGTHVYWASEHSGIFRAAFGDATCSEPSCTSPVTSGGSSAPFLVAVDASFVYWTEPASGTIRKALKTGGASSFVATDQDGPRAIAVMGDYVYWGNLGTTGATAGTIRRTKTSGATCAGAGCELVATVASPEALIAAEDGLYFTNNVAVGGGVYRLAR